jgi:hypothetical protein
MLNIHNKKIEEFEVTLFKSNQKKTVFDEIYEKIASNEGSRKSDFSKLTSD